MLPGCQGRHAHASALSSGLSSAFQRSCVREIVRGPLAETRSVGDYPHRELRRLTGALRSID